MSLETIFNTESFESFLDSKVNDAVARAMATNQPAAQVKAIEPETIRGIRGLAAFLNISIPTAQKMKNTKGFPFRQFGRVVLFRSDEVLSWMEKRPRRGRNY